MFVIIVNVMLVVLAVGGLVLPYCGWKMLRRRSGILRTPIRTITMLDRGWTAAEGRAAAATELVAPFSGRRCVYVEAVVEELTTFRVSHKPHNRREVPMWTQVEAVTTSQPFYLEDGTGRVLVSALAADTHLDVPENFTLQNVDERTGAFTHPLPPQVFESLQRLGIDPLDDRGEPRRLRYVERAIEVGQPIFVTGNHSHHGQDLTRAMPGEPVPGARSVITSEGNTRAYVSLGTAAEITRRLLWQAVGCFFGGPAVTVACSGALYLIYGVDWG